MRSGSPILSRIATYYGDRVQKYVFLDIGYNAPGVSYNKAGIDALNAQGLATRGFEPFGYWSFFNRTGAGVISDAHVSQEQKLLTHCSLTANSPTPCSYSITPLMLNSKYKTLRQRARWKRI